MFWFQQLLTGESGECKRGNFAVLMIMKQFDDRRGHRRLKLTSRKHFKPKPKLPKSLRVSISRQHVSVLKVSLPIELVNFRVSVPITSFLSAPALTVHDLYRRLQSWRY